jgi:hypothetical protein
MVVVPVKRWLKTSGTPPDLPERGWRYGTAPTVLPHLRRKYRDPVNGISIRSGRSPTCFAVACPTERTPRGRLAMGTNNLSLWTVIGAAPKSSGFRWWTQAGDGAGLRRRSSRSLWRAFRFPPGRGNGTAIRPFAVAAAAMAQIPALLKQLNVTRIRPVKLLGSSRKNSNGKNSSFVFDLACTAAYN